jgi:hypothetical protein
MALRLVLRGKCVAIVGTGVAAAHALCHAEVIVIDPQQSPHIPAAALSAGDARQVVVFCREAVARLPK